MIMFKDSKYKAGRLIAGVFYWLAVAGIIIGTMPLLYGLVELFDSWQTYGSLSIGAALLGLLYEAWIIFAGLFAMALSQVFKAHFDNADNSFK